MRIFPHRSAKPLILLGFAAATGAFSFAATKISSHQNDATQTIFSAKMVALSSTIPTRKSLSPQAKMSKAETPQAKTAKVVAQTVSYVPKPQGRILRVGLTTLGGQIVMVSSTRMIVTDAAQSGRRIEIAAGENVIFSLGITESVQARGQTFSGNIRVQTKGLLYAGWKIPKIANNGIARLATDGADPRGRRGYHGDFEIAPQTFSFEPAMHKSALRVVNVLTLDQYLDGVVPWEMDKNAPMEALKAQAICARSETLAKIADGRHAADGFDICDYDHCQGYSGTENENARTNRAVDETSGLVIAHNGRIADAVYGTNSGGITSASEDVWRGPPEPYLKSVRDFSPTRHRETAQLLSGTMNEAKWAIFCTRNLPSFAQPTQSEVRALANRRRDNARTAALFQADDLPEFYRWTRVVSAAQMSLILKAPNAVATQIRVLDRAPSGHIKRLQIVGRDSRGTALFATYEKDSQIRAMFSGRLGSTTALPSSTFVVFAQRDANNQIAAWVFKGAGWGHGAGMCQRGAQNHALAGWSARQILSYYFRGVSLARVAQ